MECFEWWVPIKQLSLYTELIHDGVYCILWCFFLILFNNDKNYYDDGDDNKNDDDDDDNDYDDNNNNNNNYNNNNNNNYNENISMWKKPCHKDVS